MKRTIEEYFYKHFGTSVSVDMKLHPSRVIITDASRKTSVTLSAEEVQQCFKDEIKFFKLFQKEFLQIISPVALANGQAKAALTGIWYKCVKITDLSGKYLALAFVCRTLHVISVIYLEQEEDGEKWRILPSNPCPSELPDEDLEDIGQFMKFQTVRTMELQPRAQYLENKISIPKDVISNSRIALVSDLRISDKQVSFIYESCGSGTSRLRQRNTYTFDKNGDIITNVETLTGPWWGEGANKDYDFCQNPFNVEFHKFFEHNPPRYASDNVWIDALEHVYLRFTNDWVMVSPDWIRGDHRRLPQHLQDELKMIDNLYSI